VAIGAAAVKGPGGDVLPAVARAESLPADFTTAFPLLYVAAFRAAFRLLGEHAESEDIAQEACARACLRWKGLHERPDVRPWVVRVASNLAIDTWRRRERAARRDVDAVANVAPVDARRVDLHRALASLPPRQREVVILRYLHDMSEVETADALGCAQGTVKSHASRGLAALRNALGEASV
jgi:RNA polymerase sigma-70 factor (sigma-E family)